MAGAGEAGSGEPGGGGTEEDAGTEVKDVDKCGLCGGDPMKKGNLKDAVLRLIPYVTARNIKR